MNSSLENNSVTEEDVTHAEDNTQGSTDAAPQSTLGNGNQLSSNEDSNGRENIALTDNASLDTGERGEFIELGGSLSVPAGMDPDTVTLQSGTSDSIYSGTDTASACSTLDHSSTTSSLHKGKTHRRSVSGVSCISKTSVEPSVSKVDEEPCQCKSCDCDCNCKPGESCGSECSECKRLRTDPADDCDVDDGDTLQVAADLADTGRAGDEDDGLHVSTSLALETLKSSTSFA